MREAIQIHVAVRNRRFEGVHRCAHALALLSLGRAAEAAPQWSRGLAILKEIGDADSVERMTGEMRVTCREAGVRDLVPQAPEST
ncbi:MAG: hypothetical protein AAB074_22730 [Planctomycetota bacterium]